MARFSKARWEAAKGLIDKPYDLNSVLYFGKYKNCTVREILGVEHQYIRYLINNCNKEFTGEVLELLERYEDYANV